jgi:ribonuclease R
VVSAVTSFGIFVTLDAMFVEGLVHITELGGEYFRFDEARQELRGERTGMRYVLGTRVRVQVSRVDLDGRRIDFRLLTENDGLLPRLSRDRDLVNDDADRKVFGDGAGGVKGGRRSRNIAEPLPRAAKRSGGAKVPAAKDKARKPRRRS